MKIVLKSEHLSLTAFVFLLKLFCNLNDVIE